MTRIHENPAPTKQYPYDVDPDRPVFLQGVSLTANQEKDIELPGSTVIVFFHKMLMSGVGGGEVSIAFGERGDFLELAPGDSIQLSKMSRVRFRNNTPAAKQFSFVHTNDREFKWENYNRGL